MNLHNLEEIFKDKPAFQLRQAKEAVFKHLIGDWQEATNLPTGLREILNEECPLNPPAGGNAEFFVSEDKNTIKALVTLEDGLKIETVLMRYKTRRAKPASRLAGLAEKNTRNTICVSSQVGCPLGCLFCATGKAGFKRNLTTDEILEQVLLFGRYLKKSSSSPPPSKGEGWEGVTDQHVNNVVFMGMGEPFLNYENVMAAIRILNDQKQGMSIGARHISISTVGITEGIKKLIDEPLQVNLAISLHAPNNELRSKIVPMNEKYPIEAIIKSISDYLAKTGRKVMFEYIMIKGLNDAPEQAKKLADLIKKLDKKLCMVNLISYNPTGIFEPSPQEIIKKFKDVLIKAGIETTQRYKFGSSIKAACGQLAGE